MKPTYATQCLLRLGEWVAQTLYCVQIAINASRHGDPINAEWWIDRAKIHGATLRLMQHEYRASLRQLRTENSEPRT